MNDPKLDEEILLLEPELGLDLLRRFVSERAPTPLDWKNLFRPIDFKFKKSWQGLIIYLILGLYLILSLWQIYFIIEHSPAWYSISNIIYFVYGLLTIIVFLLFLDASDKDSGAFDYMLLSIYYILKEMKGRGYPSIPETILGIIIRLVIFFFPAFIAYYGTLALLRYLPVKQVILIDAIAVIALAIAYIVGKRKDRNARNLLYGILNDKEQVRSTIFENVKSFGLHPG